MSQLLDGYGVAKVIRNELKIETQALVESGKRRPCLAVVLVGDDPASMTYVASKEKQAIAVGFESRVLRFDASLSQDELIREITCLNNDQSVDGILIQLPLPSHFDENTVIENVCPKKDVDGLTLKNVGKLVLGQDGLVPCTPKGILTLLDYYNISLQGAKVLVIGRSRLVGKPLAHLLLNRNATVTIAHSKTKNLHDEIQKHDIIVVAIGKKEFIRAESIREDHILIDVGIHRDSDGSLKGDVDAHAYLKAKYASPVPKGVGPMTIASLLQNTLIAYKKGV